MEGVLVTRQLQRPLAAECGRCLDPVEHASTCRSPSCSSTSRRPQADDEVLLVDGDFVDLEPVLRDAVVLALPLNPVCAEDCAGLCAGCGLRSPSCLPTMLTTPPTPDGRRCSLHVRRNDHRYPEETDPWPSRSAERRAANTHSRRSQWKATAPTLVDCPRCRQPKLPHVACTVCGTYNDRQVVKV